MNLIHNYEKSEQKSLINTDEQKTLIKKNDEKSVHLSDFSDKKLKKKQIEKTVSKQLMK